MFLWVIGFLAAIVAGVLADYVLSLFLPKKPKTKHIFAIVFSIIVLSLIAFCGGNPANDEDDTIDAVNANLADCDFINEIYQKAEIIEWIDTPTGSQKWSGVQVRTKSTITIPEGWIAHTGNNDDQLGPLTT